MQPLKLTDSEMDALLNAARPIDPNRRDEFLQACAAALSDLNERGPGATYRVIRETQRRYFDPPDLTNPVIRHGGNGF
jgi:hypothetical protein